MEFMGRAPSVTACVAVLAFFGVVLGGQRQFVRIRLVFALTRAGLGPVFFFRMCLFTSYQSHTPDRTHAGEGVFRSGRSRLAALQLMVLALLMTMCVDRISLSLTWTRRSPTASTQQQGLSLRLRLRFGSLFWGGLNS